MMKLEKRFPKHQGARMNSRISSDQIKPILIRIATVAVFMAASLMIVLWIGNDFLWPYPWLLTLVSAIISVIGLVVVKSSTIAERGRKKTNTEAWDKVITSSAGILYFIFFVFAGLDHRFTLTAVWPYGWQVLALAFYIAGNALVVWAMKVNAFFSNEVRIQNDRGQSVCDQGPYRFIRHPGYSGIIVYYLAMPIVLGSWLAMIPSLITIVLMIIRTIKEDRLLHEKLPGYKDYSKRVRTRLIPRVW